MDTTLDPSALAETRRLSRVGFVIGSLVLAGAAVRGLSVPDQFFHSYLVGFLFWNGLAVGALAVLMLQYLTGGAWGIAIRRELEAATRTLPLTAVLFVPIAFGMPHIYEWTHADVMAHDELLRKKAAYLNTPFFLVRTAIAFAAWILIAYFLNRLSREQDTHADHRAIDRKLQLLSGGGLVIYALTTTFTSVDWAMSIDPHWYSTMYGVIFMVGQALGGLALGTFAVLRLAHAKPVSEFLRGRHLHDLGKMMFAFTMIWAYVNFSQYLIVWSGNMPEEIHWYLARFRGGWGWVGFAILLLHFVLPFLLLLSRRANRDPKTLSLAAGLLLFMRLVDLAWLVLPAFSAGALRIHPSDLVVPIGIGGLWLGLYYRNLSQRPLLPVNDPGFEEALVHGHE